MNKKFCIVLVEDSEGDIVLLQQVLLRFGPSIEIVSIRDGESALQFFGAPEKSIREKFPDLVILDLNLPKIGGLDILLQIKSSDLLRTLPVIILTTSESEQDIKKAYRLGANTFISKPASFSEFSEKIILTVQYWTKVASLYKIKIYENNN